MKTDNDTLNTNLFGESKIRIFLHLLIWAILIFLPLYYIMRLHIIDGFSWFFYVNLFIDGIFFYTNYLFIVPRFYFQGRRYRYIVSLTVFLVIIYFSSFWINLETYKILSSTGQIERMKKEFADRRKPKPSGQIDFPEGPVSWHDHLIRYGTSSLFLAFLALGIRTIERNNKIEKEQKELQQEKTVAELALLKHQISPHFLFNTLNNIYSLSTINPEGSGKAILRLSKMMRYLIYETEEGDTRLSDEIDLIKNYVDLMKLRLDEKFNLKIDLPGEYTDFKLPPLLFVPFVENAFKHGISFREDSFIEISLSTTGESILFRTVNSCALSSADTGLEFSGIGLSNVRKRLDLLFPRKHDIKINETQKTFEVLLKIDIAT